MYELLHRGKKKKKSFHRLFDAHETISSETKLQQKPDLKATIRTDSTIDEV